LNGNHIVRLTSDDVDNHERFHLRCVIDVTTITAGGHANLQPVVLSTVLWAYIVDYARPLAERPAVVPRREHTHIHRLLNGIYGQTLSTVLLL